MAFVKVRVAAGKPRTFLARHGGVQTGRISQKEGSAAVDAHSSELLVCRVVFLTNIIQTRPCRHGQTAHFKSKT